MGRYRPPVPVRVGRHPWRSGAASGVEHRPISSSGPSCRCAEDRRPNPDETSPHSIRAELRFPPFARRAFGCLEDRRRGRSVENALPRCLFEAGHPNQATSQTAPPRRHENRFPSLIHWHGADGVIHALSTATIPKQSSRGGQRVGNPLDGLGHGRFRPSHAVRAVAAGSETSPFRIRCRRPGNGVPDPVVYRNIARFNTARSPAVADAYGHGALMEHRPIQTRRRALVVFLAHGSNIAHFKSGAELRFPPLRPPRLRLHGGPAPWTKRGKRAAAVALAGARSASPVVMEPSSAQETSPLSFAAAGSPKITRYC